MPAGRCFRTWASFRSHEDTIYRAALIGLSRPDFSRTVTAYIVVLHGIKNNRRVHDSYDVIGDDVVESRKCWSEEGQERADVIVR